MLRCYKMVMMVLLMTKVKTVEMIYEDGVFKPVEKIDLGIPEGTKVTFELKDPRLLKKRLQKYTGILKIRMSSEELNELYHDYVTERTDIP